MTDKTQIRMIICDVDNTIIPHGEDCISPRLSRAFRSCRDKGIEIMIDTGRHYDFLQPNLFEELPMDRIGTINGSCVTDREGHVLMSHPMDQSVMERMTQLSIEHGFGLGYKFEDAIVTYANNARFLDGYVGANQAYRSKIINDDEKRSHHLTHGLPLGIFLIAEDEEVEPFLHELPGMTFAWSSRRGYDVFLDHINKANAVEFVLKEKGLSWDQVIAFGDAGNDTPMIKKAGIGVAMGNAKDDVLQHADIIADSCREDGVAKVLEQLELA